MSKPRKLSPLERAQALLQEQPRPADIGEQIKALEAEANQDEKRMFAWIWEGIAVDTYAKGVPLK